MSTTHDGLFDAFHRDHAVLGRGFHELSTRLAVRDLPGAARVARQLEGEGGAHIAFEERVFYPLMRRLLGDPAVDRMYREHARGHALIGELLDLPAQASLPQERWGDMLDRSRQMELHIAECGSLFAAMGRLTPDEHDELFEHLTAWRKEAPRWTEVAGSVPSG